jgi:hypothetical protein
MHLDLAVGAWFAPSDSAQVEATDICPEYRQPVKYDRAEVTHRIPVAQRTSDGPRREGMPNHRVGAPEPVTVDVDPRPDPDDLTPPNQPIESRAVEVAQRLGGRDETVRR